MLAAEAVHESLADGTGRFRWRTLFKVIAAVALVWMWLKLVELVLVIIVAVLLAVTLNPIVNWLERRRLPRAAAATVVGFVLVAVVGGFLAASWASLSSRPVWRRNTSGSSSRTRSSGCQDGCATPSVDTGAVDIQSQIAPYALGSASPPCRPSSSRCWLYPDAVSADRRPARRATG